MNEIDAAGFLDRFKFWESFKVYKDVTVGDVLALLRACQAKDAAAIRLAVVTVADHAGFSMEADEVEDVVDKLMAKDWKGVVYEACDATMKFLVKHGGYVPEVKPADETFSITARKPIAEMTVAECQTWYAENKGTIRTASGTWPARRILAKRCPDILNVLEGTMTAEAVAKLTPEQIIRGLNIAIAALTVVAAFYPPVGLVVTALKIVLARYESNNPDVGMALADLL